MYAPVFSGKPGKVGRDRRSRRRTLRCVALAIGCAAALGLITHVPVVGAAAHSQLTIRPSDDGYVAQYARDSNYDTERLSASSIPGEHEVTFLKFDVPELPEGAYAPTATVILTRDLHHLPDSVELSAVASSEWSEQTLTMSNAPALGPRLARATPTRETTKVVFVLPAGAMTSAGLHSVAVTSAATDDVARFRSSDFAADGPRLVLSYWRVGNSRALPGPPPSPGPPPPPDVGDSGDMWIGAAANELSPSGTTPSGIDVFNESNADIGPLVYRRSFDSSLPSSFQSSAARDDAANGYRSFVSWKPPNGDYVGVARGRYDAQVIAWAESVPDTGVYATSFHEPENNMTGPQFVALQRHLYTVVKAANPSIQWGPVYMSYWWDEATSHYIGDKDAWWPGNNYADFTAVDTYSAKQPVPLESDPEFRGWYDYMLNIGKPMLITEYGQYAVAPGQQSDPQMLTERAATIRQDAAWLAEQDTISMWLYWDALGDQGDWRLNDPETQQAWREVAQSGRTG